jgi:TPR repeat protein
MSRNNFLIGSLIFTTAFLFFNLREPSLFAKENSNDLSLHALIQSEKTGNVLSHFDLGLAYYKGQVVNKNLNLATHWLKLDIGKSQGEAEYYLGKIAEERQPHSISEALDWYRKAAQQRHTKAAATLGHFYFTGEHSPQDYALASRYYRISAENNDIASQMMIAKLTLTGMGIPKNTVEAMGWYRRAAQLGHAEAAYNIGLYSLGGSLDKLKLFRKPNQMTLEAISYLNLAANQHYAPAEYVLGMIYLQGVYVRMDKQKGIALITRASDKNYIPALKTLGQFYQQGLNTAQDQDKAKFYNELAKYYGDKASSGYDSNFVKTINQASYQGPNQSLTKQRVGDWIVQRTVPSTNENGDNR